MKTVVIKPVGTACNLRCAYCYHHAMHARGTHVMSDEVLGALLRGVLRQTGQPVKILWHGGEPLLAGREFYRRALDLQRVIVGDTGELPRNSIQTNATLIDDSWAEFLRESGIRVGVSVDGPADVNDQARRTSTGRGSHALVERGIDCLARAGVSFSLLCVVTATSAGQPERILESLRATGARSCDFHLAAAVPGQLSLSPSSEQAIGFLCRAFDAWFDADDPTFGVRTFVNALRAQLGGRVRTCSSSVGGCLDFVACDENGNLYSCPRFVGQSVGYLGSCVDDGYDAVMQGARAVAAYASLAQLRDDCCECRWLRACGGGCAYLRWAEGGSIDATLPVCDVRKSFFAHVSERLAEYV